MQELAVDPAALVRAQEAHDIGAVLVVRNVVLFGDRPPFGGQLGAMAAALKNGGLSLSFLHQSELNFRGGFELQHGIPKSGPLPDDVKFLFVMRRSKCGYSEAQ